MCRPEHMPACFVYDKELLFQAVNIESWILPAVYGGHIDKVAWVKPIWAKQIPPGKHLLQVGEWNKEIYVHSTLDYFITEGAYCPKKELKNMKELCLYSLDFDQSLKEAETFSELASSPFILDIDLDFFSTKNPFKDIHAKANTYERLGQIYVTPRTYSADNEESIIEYSRNRREHIQYLEEIFKQLDKGQAVDKLKAHPTDETLLEKIIELVRDIRKFYPLEDIDFELIHNAGCTCDFIELPHHESSKEEITEMISTFKQFLGKLKSTPTIVTISRSSYDDYCPENMVDFIQESVIEALKEVFRDEMTDEPDFLYLE